MAASRALSDKSAAGASTGADAGAAKSPKYRLSCDQCQNMKVRCSRDKPSCRRCAQRGVSCVYSPLRRIGRPRKIIHDGIGLDDDEDEDEVSESMIRISSTLSPGSECYLGAVYIIIPKRIPRYTNPRQTRLAMEPQLLPPSKRTWQPRIF